MKKNKLNLCYLIVFQLIVFTTQAQLSIGLTGGVASRWSTPKSTDALGLGYTISAKYNFYKGITAGVHYSNFNFGPEEKLGGNTDYKIHYYAYTASLEYHYQKYKCKPYIGSEFGLVNFYTVTTLDLQELGKQKSILDKNYFGIAPVIGANYAIHKRLNINANIKLNLAFIEQGDPIGYASFNLGLVYNLIKAKE